MNNKNSRIILSKDINLDREYVNVLSYTEAEMISLCNNKAIYQYFYNRFFFSVDFNLFPFLILDN